ncbi:MAG: Nif3-like dinuclear metal center hexameric protein [Clostridiales Family XIII bacterium]|jgi:dinuclear metal center YbgI/SA1388 family protein|nr:Nif3-like dinuclear metal center hexameric protein [Clostridiales Family XIII bacterium]
MIKNKELIEAIEGAFPPGLQEEWDNCGWQIDLLGPDGDAARALVALEITSDVVREADELGADVIVEHHPLFFGKFASIDASPSAIGAAGAYAASLIRAGISVYAAHTNFDTAAGGMNDALARAFGLTGITGFPAPGSGDAGGEGGKWRHSMGRKGMAPGRLRTFADFCAEAETVFGMEGRLRTVGDPDAEIRSVALCGGAGGDFVPDAIGEGVGLYITSDVKHHEAQWAREKGLCLIDGGHWGTEKIFTPVMASFLRGKFGSSLEVVESIVSCDPWR